MKISVSVNLLIGVWIWLHNQSSMVDDYISDKVGHLVGLIEQDEGSNESEEDHDSRGDEQTTNSRTTIKGIINDVKRKIASTAKWGFISVIVITVCILFIVFFMNNNYVVSNVWLWLVAFVLTSTGPAVMAFTYVRILRLPKKAVTKATTKLNKAAGELRDRRPEGIPEIPNSPEA